MGVPHIRSAAILLCIGFTPCLTGSAAAQEAEPNLVGTVSPALCAGLFQGSLTLPAEPDPIETAGPLNLDDVSRRLALQAPAPKPGQPAHTGFGALVRAIGSDFRAFPQRKSTWVILAIGGGAAAAVHPADDDINHELQESKGLKRTLDRASISARRA